MRLSNAVAEACRAGAGGATDCADVPDALERIREGVPEQAELDELVRGLADRIAPDARFASIDYDLVQALLYLQAPSPRVKASVLKYLRCEDLTPHDRRDLGGIVPRTYASAPQWVIQRLGELMWAVEKVPLVLCVDQLEDMFDLGEAPARFRRVLATLCDITSRLPSAIVVISCLENFFDEVKRHLTQPISRRVTAGPGPVELPAACDRDQVVALIGRRLESLYRSAGVRYHPDEPTHPLPDALVRRLVGLARATSSTRSAATASVASRKGRWSSTLLTVARRPPGRRGSSIARSWPSSRRGTRRDRHRRSWSRPTRPSWRPSWPKRSSRAPASSAPLGGHFEAEADGRFVQAEHHGVGGAVGRFLVGVCNKGPQAGALCRQIDEVVQRAGGITPVDRALDGVPRQRQGGGGPAAQRPGRRRRPPRGRRGLGLADHAGSITLPRRPRAGPGLRRLARADTPPDQPRGLARDPGPGRSRRAGHGRRARRDGWPRAGGALSLNNPDAGNQPGTAPQTPSRRVR